MIFPRSLSDVLRRLLVVIGCVVLATAQPMSAFGASAPAAKHSSDLVIDPNGGTDRTLSGGTTTGSGSGFGSSLTLMAAVVLAGIGGWLVWKKKIGIGGVATGGTRKLLIEETRSLGNRQHLVVASYEGRRFLLGVTTGRIDLLTHLSDDDLDLGPPEPHA